MAVRGEAVFPHESLKLKVTVAALQFPTEAPFQLLVTMVGEQLSETDEKALAVTQALIEVETALHC